MSEASPGGRRVGLVMMLICWLMILALALWWFREFESHRENPNAELVDTRGSGEPVRLERNAYGHFVAPGKIDGHPVTFLVDTGATYVSVSEALAETLALVPEREATFITANGRVMGHLTTLGDVQLGGLAASDVAGSIHAGIDEDTVLLGMSFLGRFDIAIRGDSMVLATSSR